MDDDELEKTKTEYDTWWAYNDLHLPGCYECGYGHKRVRCSEGERLHEIWLTALRDLTDYMSKKGGRPWSYVGGYGDQYE